MAFSFTSLQFYLLLVPVTILFLLSRKFFNARLRELTLLSLNLIFLLILVGQLSSWLAIVAISSTAYLYALCVNRVASRKAKNTAFAAYVLFLLLLLVSSKYRFINHSYLSWLSDGLSGLLRIDRPLGLIGLSYLIFKQIHFARDFKDEAFKLPSFVRMLNFLLFFPCYLSGPLDRFQRFSAELNALSSTRSEDTVLAISRIGLGLFKKVVIVAILSPLSIQSVSAGLYHTYPMWKLAAKLYAYTFLLYFDFSGYTDIAVGVARLLGIRVPENFNAPFHALSIQDYWNRWHISLSQWIRDYIYYPLYRLLSEHLSSLNSTLLGAVSLFLSFLLCGLWHGEGWNFAIWGGLHGMALAIYLIYRELMKHVFEKKYALVRVKTWYRTMSWALTFNYIVITNLFFALEFKDARQLLVVILRSALDWQVS